MCNSSPIDGNEKKILVAAEEVTEAEAVLRDEPGSLQRDNGKRAL